MASHDSDCPYLETEDDNDCICGALEDEPMMIDDEAEPPEDEDDDEED